MNWAKVNRFIKFIFPNYIWSIPNTSNKVYLTFDDGPIPEITEWVLDLLKEEEIKATFFCIGENIAKNNLIFKRILSDGHIVGNHTFNHLKGWQTKSSTYIENFEKCENEIEKDAAVIKLFRPPYGKIKARQAKAIQKKGYKIIMWDVLSYDFSETITKEKCLKNVLENTESGSIIVFHDSIKAEEKLKYALPRVIKALKEKGFLFDTIP